jgi:hypothetical protein
MLAKEKKRAAWSLAIGAIISVAQGANREFRLKRKAGAS